MGHSCVRPPRSSCWKYRRFRTHQLPPVGSRGQCLENSQLVRGGVSREAVPNLQIIDPLVNRESSAAVKIRHEDAIDGSVVDPHVRPEAIEDHLAVDGHPDAAIGSAAAVPEDLEFHPASQGLSVSRCIFFPELLPAAPGPCGACHVVAGNMPGKRTT